MSIFDTLKAMNEQYKATPAAPDNARIPDGKYRAICKEARLIEPSETKPMLLSCSFIIMEGDYAGRMLFISQRIVAEQTAFSYLKRFIAQMQVPVDDLYQLEAALPEFTGRIITASVVTGKAGRPLPERLCGRVHREGRHRALSEARCAAKALRAGPQ